MLFFSMSDKIYAEGCRCPKSIWLDEHNAGDIQPDPYNRYLSWGKAKDSEREREVLDLAMGYYGDYVTPRISLDGGLSHMVYSTQQFLDEGKPVICRATFREGLGSLEELCQVDILRNEPDGMHIVKVSASKWIDCFDLHQLAFQFWFLSEHGYDVKSASVMHLNDDYVRNGELDLHELFTVEDVTPYAHALAMDVPNNLRLFRWFSRHHDEEPDFPWGEQCLLSPKCRYREWCERDMPKPNVIDIPGLGEKAWRMYDAGLVTYDILSKAYEAGRIQLSRRQHNQVLSHVENLDEIADREGICEFLIAITYPAYFLDMGYGPISAIPEYDGMRPYQLLPAQCAVGVQRERNGEMEWHEIVAYGEDPRRAIAEALCEHIPPDACVLANVGDIPRDLLSGLAKRFPDLSEHLISIRGNIIDLATPFSKGLYYRRDSEGWPGLKSVVETLFPYDPEVDFDRLEMVQDEKSAQEAYAKLVSASQREEAEIRQALFDYRRMRIVATAKLLDHLCGVAEGGPGDE